MDWKYTKLFSFYHEKSSNMHEVLITKALCELSKLKIIAAFLLLRFIENAVYGNTEIPQIFLQMISSNRSNLTATASPASF